MQEVYEFLKKCGTYYLGTVVGDQPHVRPFGTIDLFEGKLYIQTGKVKKVAEQMQANPKVELCAFDGQTWLRIAATAVLDDNIDAQKHMLDAYPSLQAMYQPGDGNTQVYYLKDASATFSSFTAQPRTVTF
ncbi:MAG: pyridoxamine 5'-phosphate oxidase family protein [Butyricicoccus sp.]